MERPASFRNLVKNYWLTCLIAAQPVLDVGAFWTGGSGSTAFGYVRLLIMLALPLYLLITLKKKAPFIAIMAVMGLFSALHILSCARLGYIDAVYDVAYLVRVLQMPVLAVCFVCLIRDGRAKEQALLGLFAAGALLLIFLLLSVLTGTYTETYQNIGISGWVLEDNRCANSIILVTLSVFALFFVSGSKSKAAQLIVPTVISAIFLSNGTKACYAGLFVLFAGFAAFELMNALIHKARIRKLFVAVLLLLCVGAALVYPYTPRAEASGLESDDAARRESEFLALLSSKGYDYYSMSREEILEDDALMQMLNEYYNIVRYVNPDMFERFSFERVLERYDFTISQSKLIDYRFLKRSYAQLIWEDSDALTHLFGLEVKDVVSVPSYDLENDWPALYYYYGYVGVALYGAFVLYFIYLVLKKMLMDFKGAFTLLNYSLLMCLSLQLALSELSGAILRRPNVSVYLSLILALIYYQTRRVDAASLEEAADEA